MPLRSLHIHEASPHQGKKGSPTTHSLERTSLSHSAPISHTHHPTFPESWRGTCEQKEWDTERRVERRRQKEEGDREAEMQGAKKEQSWTQVETGQREREIDRSHTKRGRQCHSETERRLKR